MDKAKLLAPRAKTASGFPEDDVEVPGMGTVRVRGLSRDETIDLQVLVGSKATECAVIALGLVDPVMTEDEVAEWQHVGLAGELEPVSTKIAELSGMLEDSAKAAYKSDGDEPDV